MPFLKYVKQYISDNFFKKYMILEQVGRGKYSEVFKVLSHSTGEVFALKIIPKEGLSKEELIILNNEFKIMEVLRHKNTIKVFEMIEIKDRYEYIMEFV